MGPAARAVSDREPKRGAARGAAALAEPLRRGVEDVWEGAGVERREREERVDCEDGEEGEGEVEARRKARAPDAPARKPDMIWRWRDGSD